jgi:CO dehydrogenase maturation factor
MKPSSWPTGKGSRTRIAGHEGGLLKIAIAGKGGSGKTTLAGTLARQLARRGHAVLAVDGDANPNLGLSLGLGPEATERLVAARQELDRDPDADHAGTVEEIIDRFGADAPDGVRLIQVSRIDNPQSGCP